MAPDDVDEARWQAYLYERHSPAELRGWANRLALFRFCRAQGGHANDGDQLRVVFAVPTEPDLRAALTAIGIEPAVIPADAPRPVAGRSYTGTEYAAFIVPIDEYPHLAQPSWVRLADADVHVWVAGGRLALQIADTDSPYDVTEAAVRAAESVEAALAPIRHLVIDPPLDRERCICPKYYPEFWS